MYMTVCQGDAHSNPHIDHCTQCAPLWGQIPHCSNCDSKRPMKVTKKYYICPDCKKRDPR